MVNEILRCGDVPSHRAGTTGEAETAAKTPSPPQLVESNVIDLEAMKASRIVRALVPYSKTIYFIDKCRQFGTTVEFGLSWKNI